MSSTQGLHKSAATRRDRKQQCWVLTREGSHTDTSLGETPKESVQTRAINKHQETSHVNNRLLYHNALPVTALYNYSHNSMPGILHQCNKVPPPNNNVQCWHKSKFRNRSTLHTFPLSGYFVGLVTFQHTKLLLLISNFHHVLNVVCFLLGNSLVSEFYMPTFRNTLFHLHRQIGMKYDWIWEKLE